MRAVQRLKAHLKNLYSKDVIWLTPADCLYIFAKSRQIIETENSYEVYPMVSFFSNWSLHTNLSNSTRVHKMFSDLAGIFADGENGSFPNINDKVNDVVSFDKLRKELNSLFEKHSLDTTVFTEEEPWYAFLSLLNVEITEKPIEFKKPRSDASTDRLKKSYEISLESMIKKGIVLDRFLLIGIKDEPLQWHVTTSSVNGLPKQLNYQGTICKTERGNAFRSPTMDLLPDKN
jgi:hypothetical protein